MACNESVPLSLSCDLPIYIQTDVPGKISVLLLLIKCFLWNLYDFMYNLYSEIKCIIMTDDYQLKLTFSWNVNVFVLTLWNISPLCWELLKGPTVY